MKDTPNDPKGKETETEELEIVGLYDGDTLMVLKEATPTLEKKWSWKNISRSTGMVHGYTCTMHSCD